MITKDQQKLLNQIKTFVTKHQSKPKAEDRLPLVNNFSARERRFVQELADSLRLNLTWDEVDAYGQSLAVLSFNMEGVSEDGDAVEEEGEGEEEWESDGETNNEGDVAIQRVFEKYNKAKVVENTVDDFEEDYEATLKGKMSDWKKEYYKVRCVSRCIERFADDVFILGRISWRLIWQYPKS